MAPESIKYITEPEFQKLVDLEEKATGAPWTKVPHHQFDGFFGIHSQNLKDERDDGTRDMPFVVYPEGEVLERNADLIFEARNQLKPLLTALANERKRVEKLKADNAALMGAAQKAKAEYCEIHKANHYVVKCECGYTGNSAEWRENWNWEHTECEIECPKCESPYNDEVSLDDFVDYRLGEILSQSNHGAELLEELERYREALEQIANGSQDADDADGIPTEWQTLIARQALKPEPDKEIL